MKLAVQTLIMAIPKIINVIIISLLVFLIFGILGVNYFKGSFYSCNHHSYLEGGLPADVLTKWDCLNLGGAWLNADSNFDNIFESTLLLF